ncbi:GntR family transcriptional regulator, partial [Nocardiopsis synnemataformans]|uniref:GntR family transcriptional regulator n=1 Tax=Nocardiopsis synnemataformans TaxID=61305 RepID=UPI003EBDF059
MPPRARWGTYQTIAETLRARLSGAVPGSAVPSEAELKEEFGVSRTLVRRALGLLEGEGLVRAVPGRGRVVAAAEPPEPGGRQQMVSELRRRVSELDAGARLPSEAALGDEFGVSR